ncbi:type VI secretion protein IcmF/TssM N-terminal domain-containing protein [Thalassotalea montiporae]
MSRKLTHILAIIVVIVALLLSTAIVFLPLAMSWWWLVAALVFVVIAMYTIPPMANLLTKAITRRRQRRYLHASYQHIKKKLKLPSNIYETAWFFACAQDTCEHDFSQFHQIKVPNLPANIKVYHVEGALVWLLSPKQDYDTSLFVEWLKVIRPKQPVNGAMLILDAFNLVQRAHKQTDIFIDRFKHGCEELHNQSDILSPLHVFVSGINKLDGIAEAIYEQSDFAQLSIDLTCGDSDKTAVFSTAYDELFKSLFVANIKQVSLQLDEDFKRKQLLGPMQLQYLKLSIEQLFSSLQSFDGADLPYQLTSLHLVESEHAEQRINLATAHALINVNQVNLPVVHGTNLKPQASLQKAFTHGVLAQSFKAPVNRLQVATYWLKQGLMVFSGAALLGFAAWVGYLNFAYNEGLHAQFDRVHQEYKLVLNQQKFDIEEPSSILGPLEVLEKAYRKFKAQEQDKPWFVMPFIASIEREKHYRTLYQQQLVMALQPTLSSYLEEELFVYLELKDYLTVLNIENVYESFASANADNQDIILDYFTESFLNSGVMSREQIREFAILLTDLFELGYEPFDVNNELIAIVDAEISTQNRFQLLYQYIEDLPEFSKLNDVRSVLFGENMLQSGGKDLLYFDQTHASFLVPNLYTPGGLLQLSFIPNSGFFQTLVKRNHGLFRKIPEPRDMERLGSYLKYTYINEYVGFWREYLTHIKAREDMGLKQLLAALTKAEDSPLPQLNSGVRHFVNIPLITIEPTPEQQVKAPKKLAATLKKVETVADNLLPEKQELTTLMAQEQNEIATKINQAFDDNLLLSGSTKQVDAIYQSIQKDLLALKEWLDKADNEVIPGKAYFEDVTNEKSYQAFANLWLNDYEQTLIDHLIDNIVAQSSRYVENKIVNFLNTQWQTQVVAPYQRELAPFFPFSDSEEAVNIRAIDKFFASDSALAKFEQSVLSQFVEVKGKQQLALFGRQHLLTLNNDISPFITGYKTMREQLYSGADKITTNITYTPISMAPELMSFTLSTADSALNYTHGPLIGKKTLWPTDYQDSAMTISMRDKNNKRQNTRFEGIWAPMQLLAKYQDGAASEVLTIPYPKTTGVKLKVNDADKASNIINPNFFRRLTIPSQLVGQP